MNILLFIDSLGSGGAQRQLVTLAGLFKKRGYEISVLVYHEEDFFADELRKDNIPVHCISSSFFMRVWKIRRYIRRGGYDAVISFLAVPNFINCVAAIGGKTWKVITGERSSKEAFLHTRRGKVFAWFQRYADVVVCNSFNAKKMWEKYYPRYGDKIEVIYNAVVLPEINAKYIPRRNGKLNMVIAASYQYLKNPLGLVEALSRLNKEEQGKIHVNWYGKKKVSYKGVQAYLDTKKAISDYSLEESITLNDVAENILEKMYEADVIALFSKLEGMPNAICEGMMLGKPIIMTRVSDYNILVNKENGFLCDWSDINTIKTSLVSSINLTTSKMKCMGAQSKDRAYTLFDQKVIVAKWERLFKTK